MILNQAAPHGTLGTIHNASVLLDLLSRGPAFHQLTDLAERSNLSLPTVHRLLRSLMAAGLVRQDPHSSRYGLGPELVRLSEHYLERLPAVVAARPYLRRLREDLGTTVAVAVLSGVDVVYVERSDRGDADLPRRRPALDTAAGRVLLAAAAPEVWEQARADAQDGHRVLDDARRTWQQASTFLSGPGPQSGWLEFAAPLRDGHGTVAAALSTCGRAGFFEDAEVAHRTGARIAESARRLSECLTDA